MDRIVLPEELRKVEILVDGQWTPIQMTEIKAGDRFRMFEPTGEPVLGMSEETEWVAATDGYLVEGTKNLWGVCIDADFAATHAKDYTGEQNITLREEASNG
jgi:hypothetical protein